MIRRVYLWIELFLVFFAVPGLFALIVDPLDRADGAFAALGLGAINAMERPTALLMPALILFCLATLAWLLLDRSFDNRRLWGWAATKREAPRMGLTACGLMVFLTLFATLLNPWTDVLTVTAPDGSSGTALFRLPREAPVLVPLILVFYPIFSCYLQEIAYRAFFFHRYARILPWRWGMIGVNAVAFMWLHIVFWHWMALALTLPAGVLFAWTYDRTRSTLAVTLEHGLLGWWAFVVGLGWFVFTGSIGAS
ncbi:MAG: hypothetical protein CMJ31_10370 [Phycisphaerae bacterium]|nr:hypothetical protein [Phycisphaerae bacterium]